MAATLAASAPRLPHHARSARMGVFGKRLGVLVALSARQTRLADATKPLIIANSSS